MKKSILSRMTEVVNDLYSENGKVTASGLVEAARPEDSPAHDGFEWRDDVAGNEYRLIQSRNWLRKVKVIVNDRLDSFVHVPCSVVVKDDSGREVERTTEGYYKPVSVVIKNGDELDRAIMSVQKRLSAARFALMQLTRIDGAKEKVDLDKASEGFVLAMDALGMTAEPEMAEVL